MDIRHLRGADSSASQAHGSGRWRRIIKAVGATVAASVLIVTSAPAVSASDGIPVIPGGKVYGWGQTTGNKHQPPARLNGVEIIAMDGSTSHSMVLTADGSIDVWGATASPAPPILSVPPETAGRTVAIAAGNDHLLALTNDGKVHTWGSPGSDRLVMPPELDNENVTAIAGGNLHSLALTAEGKVYAWGASDGGTTRAQAVVPPEVDDAVITAIAAGAVHSVAVTDSGQVIVWGDNNFQQQLTLPASLTGKQITSVSSYSNHTLALASDGSVHAWGSGGNGAPVQVPAALRAANSGVIAVSASNSQSFALLDNGTIRTWGNNALGIQNPPTNFPSGHIVRGIATGANHGLLIAGLPPKPEIWSSVELTASQGPISAGRVPVTLAATVHTDGETGLPDGAEVEFRRDGVLLDTVEAEPGPFPNRRIADFVDDVDAATAATFTYTAHLVATEDDDNLYLGADSAGVDVVIVGELPLVGSSTVLELDTEVTVGDEVTMTAVVARIDDGSLEISGAADLGEVTFFADGVEIDTVPVVIDPVTGEATAVLDHIFATVGEVHVTAEFSGITGDSEMIAGSGTDPATVVTVSAVNGTDPPPSAGGSLGSLIGSLGGGGTNTLSPLTAVG